MEGSEYAEDKEAGVTAECKQRLYNAQIKDSVTALTRELSAFASDVAPWTKALESDKFEVINAKPVTAD